MIKIVFIGSHTGLEFDTWEIQDNQNFPRKDDSVQINNKTWKIKEVIWENPFSIRIIIVKL